MKMQRRRQGSSSPKLSSHKICSAKKTCNYEEKNNNLSSLLTHENNKIKSRRKEIFAIIFTLLISIGIYWNTIGHDFVHDDIVAIVRNPDLRPSSPWTNLLKNDYWGTPMSSKLSHKSYRPLTVLTFRLNFGISGGSLNPAWFHLTNIGIHACVSVLVYLLASRSLSLNFSTSITASTIFALHPIHTEAVAGITGRSDSLACLLMLISFLLYTESLNKSRKFKSVDENDLVGLNWLFVLSCLIGSLAMLAKENGITILGINLLYDLYSHFNLVKRWFLIKSESNLQLNLRRRIGFMVALASLSLALRILIMNGDLPRFGQQDNPASYAASNLTRFLTYSFLPVFNFWLILCPYHLSYDWQMGSIPLIESLWDLRNLYTLLFYSFFTSIFIFSFPKERVGLGQKFLVKKSTFTSVLFISLPFLPASNLLFPVGFVAAERVLYTPSIGLCLLTATGIQCLKKTLFTTTCTSSGFKKSATLLISLSFYFMLMSFSLKSWDRNMVWKSRASLFESGLRENPGNAKIHYNYANLQKDLGNIEAAVEHYKTAISLWPDYSSAHNNLGALSKNYSIAEECFLNAIRANPEHNGAHFNLAVIYIRSERYEEALEHLEECLKIDPSHSEALQYLGACFNFLNKSKKEVGTVFQKLSSSNLSPIKFHTNFGLFLQQLGRSSEALAQYLIGLSSGSSTALSLNALFHSIKLASQLGAHQLFEHLSHQFLSIEFEPGVAYMLAHRYMEKGNFEEAKSLFERLYNESDSFYRIHYAQFLIDVRRWSEAESVLRDILESERGDFNTVLLLGTVYENQNRTTEAFEMLHSYLGNFCPHDKYLCSLFYSQLGNIMHTAGALHSAADYYDMALKYNPDSVQAHTNIGAIYHLMNKYTEAREHYRAALRIEPRNGVILSNIEKLQRAELDYYKKEFSYGYHHR